MENQSNMADVGGVASRFKITVHEKVFFSDRLTSCLEVNFSISPSKQEGKP